MADLASSRLQMGGGEFCANACRAFGALLALTSPYDSSGTQFLITVSGSPEPVRLFVRGNIPAWQVTAAFSFQNVNIRRLADKIIQVDLPGITHLLLADDWPESAHLSSLSSKLRKIYNLGQYPANGIIWWQRQNEDLRILPYVEVPSSGTCMLESSCGSASLALALALCEFQGNREFSIQQPGGSLLKIILGENNKASLSGEVLLCARGELFLPDI